MKKISFILASLNIGGVEKNTLRLINGFLDRGYNVDLLVVRDEGMYKEQLDERINVIFFNKKKVSYSFIQLGKYLKENKPDVLISAKDYINIIVIMANKLSRAKVPIITSTRTQVSIELSTQTKISRYLNKSLMKWTYPSATHLVAVSNGVGKDLSNLTGISHKKIQTIYNPIIDEEIFHKKNIHVKDNKNNPNKLNLVSVGRLSKQKDYPTLLKAIKILTRNNDVTLTILGEGEERENVEQIISELDLTNIVSLKGNVSNPYPYMKASDLFVLSSKWEGFGNVIVESLAVGTPVVSTDCPSGPSEILDNGEYGELVPVESPKLLAKGILEASKKKWDKNKLIDRAKMFSVDLAVEEYIKLIEKK